MPSAADNIAALEAERDELRLELLSAMGEAGVNLDRAEAAEADLSNALDRSADNLARAIAAEARLAELTGEAMVQRIARALLSIGHLGVDPDDGDELARDLLTRAGLL